MIRFICFLIPFFFLATSLQAQESYYTVEVKGWISTAGNCGTLRGLREVKLVYTNGDQEVLNQRVHRNESFSFRDTITTGKSLSRIDILSARQTTNTLLVCREPNDFTQPENINGKQCFSKRNDEAFGVTDGWYEINITPVLFITDFSKNAEIIEDVPINLGLENSTVAVSHFNWKYSVDRGKNWKNLPSEFQNKNYISISGRDFLEDGDYGDEVWINIDTECNGSISNSLIFAARKSAPYIIGNDEPMKPKCYGDSDGSITLIFSRDLLPDENLAVAVEDISNGDVQITLDESFNEITDFNQGRKLTITGLPKSGADGYRVILFNSNLYTGGNNHNLQFEIGTPDPVSFSISNFTMVNCFEGQDGTISIEANGGTERDFEFSLTKPDGSTDPWKRFDNTNTHVISELSKGEHKIKVRDGNKCLAKEQIIVNGETKLRDIDIDLTQEIKQPFAKLSVKLLPVSKIRESDSDDASAFGFTDGRIVANITGGTGPYNLKWSKDGVAQNFIADSTITGSNAAENYTHQAILNDIGKGNYTLSVTDANHSTAGTDQEMGCFDSASLFIDEPEPLTLTLEETNPITCNDNHLDEFNDDASDGQLTAYASGGVPFEIKGATTRPYTYIWKEEVAPNTFIILEEEKDSILSGIGDGRYAVNIIDANGITVGTAVNNIVTPEDVTYYIEEPEPITISFETGNIACYGGNEGWAKATITGGNGNFQLQWSNGETVDTNESLTAGKYALFVTDEKGCKGKAEVEILEPEGLNGTTLNQKNPTCNDGTDGAIELSVSGGVSPYKYRWAGEGLDDVTLSAVEGLIAGTYSVTVTDANNCVFTKEYTLENPSPNLIELGEDRLLCGGQPMVINATFSDEGTSYIWTSDNGFTSTSPVIEVTEAGTYTVALTTELGCSGGDSITITTSEAEIDAHFVVSTQAFAGEELALINISSPLGDAVEWFFPPEAEVVVQTDEDVVLVFEKPGAYDIILRSNQGDCYLDFMKSIIVEEAEDIADIGDAINPFITEFKVYPNPSDGNFKVDIELTEASDISLKMFSMATQGLLNQRKEVSSTIFSLDYGVALSSGSYILLLETAKASEIRKVLIK